MSSALDEPWGSQTHQERTATLAFAYNNLEHTIRLNTLFTWAEKGRGGGGGVGRVG